MMIQPILRRIVPVEHALMTFYEGFPRILIILNRKNLSPYARVFEILYK